MTPRETALGTALLLALLAALLFASWDGWKAIDRPETQPVVDTIGQLVHPRVSRPAIWEADADSVAFVDVLIREERPIRARGSLRYARWWSGGRLFIVIPAESIEVGL